jgi:hypothetical protein
MCIKDVAYSSQEELNTIARLSTNLVKDLRIRNNQKETYNPTIASFLLKAKLNENKIFQFEPFWFQINSPNNEFKLYVSDAETNLNITSKCKVFVTVLLQQTK